MQLTDKILADLFAVVLRGLGGLPDYHGVEGQGGDPLEEILDHQRGSRLGTHQPEFAAQSFGQRFGLPGQLVENVVGMLEKEVCVWFYASVGATRGQVRVVDLVWGHFPEISIFFIFIFSAC